MNITVPWNASWTSEERYEIRPCRWASGKLAIWQPHTPGEGRPIFAKPHMVRQRRSIAEMRCTVCGEKTPANDQWWFQHGRFQEGWFMTTESPVHRACAEFALTVCPHLKDSSALLERMPGNYRILSSIIGGASAEEKFSLNLSCQPVGNLKIAWPARDVRRR
jgi:hypothetical protein